MSIEVATMGKTVAGMPSSEHHLCRWQHFFSRLSPGPQSEERKTSLCLRAKSLAPHLPDGDIVPFQKQGDIYKKTVSTTPNSMGCK